LSESARASCGVSLNSHLSTLNCRLDSTPAILLRKIKLSETSLIITWLTEQHGKLKTVAKGARQAKSRFAGRLDLFFECDMQFSRSRKSDLHALREAELRETYDGLRLEYPRVVLASYFVELIEMVTEAEHAVPELFDLLRRALAHLNEHPASRRALEHFENELVRLLGIANPAVSAAVAIGRAYHHIPKGRPELLKLL
jgi:DNA repair protein RecO (recombination protein O)